MTRFEVWRLLHVLSAIVWVGTGTAVTVLSALAARDADPRASDTLVRLSEKLGARLFMPASLSTLLWGVLMVVAPGTASAPYRFEDPFITLGIVGILVSMVIGMAAIGPTARRYLDAAVEADRSALGRRLQGLHLVDVAVLYAVVVLMAVRPAWW